MNLTKSYKGIISQDLQNKYLFAEVRNASAVLANSCSNEWKEVITFLSIFVLKTKSLMKSGGNKSQVVSDLEQFFYSNQWYETRLDTEEITYKVPRLSGQKGRKGSGLSLEQFTTKERLDIRKKYPYIAVDTIFQEGYLIDAVKGRVALDIEWNAKDGNLDRDLTAYRAWYQLGVIDGAILITKHYESCRKLVANIWEEYTARNPGWEQRGEKQPVDLRTTTTTTFEKTCNRIKRGDAGGCPVLVVGITGKCWDGEKYNP